MFRWIYRQIKTKQRQVAYVEAFQFFVALFGVRHLAGRVSGMPILVSTSDNWGLRTFYFQQQYDTSEVDLITRLLRPASVFWDIGANYGAYTLQVCPHLDKLSKVVAIEPAKATFSLLVETCKRNGFADQIIFVNVAGGDTDSNGLLYLSSISFGDHRIFEPSDNHILNKRRERAVEPIKICTLDSIAAKHFPDMPTRNILKIDVQGAELSVLRGATRLIHSSEYFVALVEFWPDGLRQAGVEPIDLLRFCEHQGLCILDTNHRRVSPEQVLHEAEKTFHRTTSILIEKCNKRDAYLSNSDNTQRCRAD